MSRCVLTAGLVVVLLIVITGCVPTLYNHPPVASFTWSPAAPVVGDTVTFTDGSHDEDGAVRHIYHSESDSHLHYGRQLRGETRGLR
jgi:hypothetical protein